MSRYYQLLRQLLFGKSRNVHIEALRYFIASALALLVDFSTLYLLTDRAHLHYLTSALLAFCLGIAVNYTLSRLWVFQFRKLTNVYAELAIFTIIGLIGLGLNELFIWIFTDKLHIFYLESKILTALIVYLWNFSARKILLFSGNTSAQEAF